MAGVEQKHVDEGKYVKLELRVDQFLVSLPKVLRYAGKNQSKNEKPQKLLGHVEERKVESKVLSSINFK